MTRNIRTIPFKFTGAQVYTLALLAVLDIAAWTVSIYLWISYLVFGVIR